MRFFAGLSNHKFFSLILPWITGAYFATLDIFGDRWDILKNNEENVVWGFWACLAVSLLTQFVSGLTNLKPKLDSDETARAILADFISHVGIIVEEKLMRFRSKIPLISSKADKFKHITVPTDQIDIIGREASQFLRSAYGLLDDQLDITILKRNEAAEWYYFYTLQNWKHGDPKWLKARRSAAEQCYENREISFFPDKVKSAADGFYLLSERDRRRKKGSAYIYPVSFEGTNQRVDFIISIVTYGEPFCPDYETKSVEITRAFLREICRRFEIELCLDTIKSI